MNRIFITGDTHNRIDINKLYARSFPEQKDLTKDDIVIIAGDFGGIWQGFTHKSIEEYKHTNDVTKLTLSSQDKKTIAFYERRPWTTVFCDGNHENFNAINKFPVETWNGGKVHRISDSVIHLMRGESYTINNKTFFVMGGASSIDKDFRTEGRSWWPEEIPSKTEYDHAIDTIKKNNATFDYIITHTCPTSHIIDVDGSLKYKDSVNDFLEVVKTEFNIKYKHWYFGHYHCDKEINDKITCLYQKIIEIS